MFHSLENDNNLIINTLILRDERTFSRVKSISPALTRVLLLHAVEKLPKNFASKSVTGQNELNVLMGEAYMVIYVYLYHAEQTYPASRVDVIC